MPIQLLEELRAIRGLRADRDVVFVFEDAPQAFANDAMVVGDHYRDHTTSLVRDRAGS